MPHSRDRSGAIDNYRNVTLILMHLIVRIISDSSDKLGHYEGSVQPESTERCPVLRLEIWNQKGP